MYISSSDRDSIIECYFLVEANLFSTEPILAALDEILKQRQADPDIVKWFKTKYLNWYKSAEDDNLKNIRPHEAKSGEPDWARNTVDFQGFTQQEKNNIIHIIDYFNSLDTRDRGKIEKEPYKVIINKVSEWDKQLAANMEKAAVVGKEGKDYETVMRFPDGFSIVRLISKEAYKNEGDAMGHCVGGYCPDSGSIIYSLRSPKGTSHATIEYDQAILQIKGKQDAMPIPKYRPYLIEFIKKNKMEVEEDGENIGMIRYDDTYYFPDDPKWLVIYKNKIVPLQREAIEDILSRMKNGVIEGDVNLSNLYFTEFPDALSNVTFIKGKLDLANTLIAQLPGDLKKVEGDVFLYSTPITQLPAGLKVGGYLLLTNTPITQLPAGLEVRGGLHLDGTNITQLPADLKVEGELRLDNTGITQLPAGFEVRGSLDLSNTNMKLPAGFKVGDALTYSYNNRITQLPAGLEVGDGLYLYYTPITQLPADLKVGGGLYLDDTRITQLPADLKKVKGSLSLANTPITQLPAGLEVGGNLNLSGTTSILQLPADLKVEGKLDIHNTPIDQLPADLKVGGYLDLRGTPIAKKYTEEQLKQMLPGVRGAIYK